MRQMSAARPISFLIVALAVRVLLQAGPQSESMDSAIAALERGDAGTAEQILRADLHAKPNDVQALDVLGVVLDKEGKLAEADQAYRRALGSPRPSPGLLNNYANHLLASGKPEEARKVFLKVLVLDPAHVNAHVQLARIALKQAPATTLSYLNLIPQSARDTTDVETLKMQALFALHRDSEANAILTRISQTFSADQHSNLQLGQALAACGEYDRAESVFSRVLQVAPEDFEALRDLGSAALHAGHYERARQALQAALEQQPSDVDVLYDLAAVDIKLNRKETAIEDLTKAAKLAPDRADVQARLAYTTADLGFYGDAVEAWDRYLHLVPGDDIARRERGFAQTALGVNSGLDALQEFVRKHPSDAIGHYELGIAYSTTEPVRALDEFSRSLTLKPGFAPALMGRALLNHRQGRPAAALPDLELAAKHEPDNARVLDRLGQTYLALERAPDAVRTLRKAADLDPGDSTILLHLSRSLIKTGQTDQARAVMLRVRELGPNRSNLPHPAGFVDFLSLSPQEQYARYRTGVERTVSSNPQNSQAQVQYLKLVLDDGKIDEAAAVCRTLIALAPAAGPLADAANSLIEAQQYAMAKTFLEQAVAIAGSDGDLGLDVAIATWRVTDAKAGLDRMDRIPAAQRSGDYYLARAEMLNGIGRFGETPAAVEQALRAVPKRSDLYRDTAVSLVKYDQVPDALRVIDQGAVAFPNDPAILLTKAGVLEAAKRTDRAESLLKEIEKRWPEWSNVWLADAALHDGHAGGDLLGTLFEQGKPR